jgi:hypothetical protein
MNDKDDKIPHKYETTFIGKPKKAVWKFKNFTDQDKY